MGKKGFTSLFFKLRDHHHAHAPPPPQSTTSSPSPSSSPWSWATCRQPKTSSFRAGDADDFYKTVNSAYFDSTESTCFTNSSEEVEIDSFSTASDESAETVLRGLRSDRLFFEPGDTSSILEEVKVSKIEFPFKDSTMVLAMESNDPCHDFMMSMEEMVMAHGIKESRWLEELLVWYLRVNVKKNHGFILAAFVDLLVGIASSPEYYSSSSSSSSSPSSMTFDEIEEAEDEDEGSESC